jgi:putative hydrolase of HD superfamily
MGDNRLEEQIRWITEIDKLKGILRQTLVMDGSRQENDAEHSWHVAVMAVLLHEYAAPPDVDLLRVVKMLLIHDLVEIDAGDTFCYDAAGVALQQARERKAADRIFGLLPADQGQALRGLWDEFDARETPHARFAHALDRIQPLLNNLHTGGGSWKRHAVRVSQVLERIAPAREGSPALHDYACGLVEQAAEAGLLIRDQPA